MMDTVKAEYWNTRELATFLNRSKKFVEKYRDRLPGAVRIGGRWAYRRQDVEKKLLSGQLLLPATK